MLGPNGRPRANTMDSSNNSNNMSSSSGADQPAPWDNIPTIATINGNNNPMMPRPAFAAAAGAGGGGMDPTQAAIWRERERRQRTIRMLMMFLLMLLLMDGDETNSSLRKRPARPHGKHARQHLSSHVFTGRLNQESALSTLTRQHPRYQRLMELNGGNDVPLQVQRWAEQRAEHVKDEFGAVEPQQLSQRLNTHDKKRPEKDPEDDKAVWHYPWNATGFYRGEWVRDNTNSEKTNIPDGSSTTVSVNLERQEQDESSTEKKITEEPVTQYFDAVALETPMRSLLQQSQFEKEPPLGVFLLPEGTEVIMRSDNNLTSDAWDQFGTDGGSSTNPGRLRGSGGTESTGLWDSSSRRHKQHGRGTADDSEDDPATAAKVTLTKPSGRAAFQLFSRSVPSMKEISLVDGFLKLYDSDMPGYSTRKDILLRVRGVLIHSIGRISLVSNAGPGRSVLVMGDAGDDNSVENALRRRRLEEALSNLAESEHVSTTMARKKTNRSNKSVDILVSTKQNASPKADTAAASTTTSNPAFPTRKQVDRIRDDVLALFGKHLDKTTADADAGGGVATVAQSMFQTLPDATSFSNPDILRQERNDVVSAYPKKTNGEKDAPMTTTIRERRTKAVTANTGKEGSATESHTNAVESLELQHKDAEGGSMSTFTWSDIVIPYPFILDDEEESIRKARTPASRRMPPREQLLERNAGRCEFEVNMDTKEVKWTVGEWRKLIGRRVHEAMELNPANHRHDGEADGELAEEEDKNDRKKSSVHSRTKSRQRRTPQDQALVMTMIGSIRSPNCDFSAALNVTALRTDWEHTTGKAINYSFYMMLTCLTQIMVLLRQLLHTQAQSAATRVSLLCIGWQTVLDALLCLSHIYLSLAMQPLFTAFASVAFFKLLIFCVIEMKYMALIIQARNSSNGGNTTELLRRQVAMLHLRFYVALFGAFLAFFYAGEKYRLPYILALYSFWIPQIVQNVITEAKRPMHTYYIYGMSITRLVAPLYIFAVPNNFLKEVYPESPTDLYMCELLVLWVGIQTAVLIAQGKYGARFMIPARFLPPKFDYSRPIPTSMLPPDTLGGGSPTSDLLQDRESQSLLSSNPPVRDRHATGVTTRNRIKGSRVNRAECSMTAEPVLTHDPSSNSSAHSLDCVICYNSIDHHNRRGYMLAPCDHIFHRDCLVQWMDIKMECPICRTELPSL